GAVVVHHVVANDVVAGADGGLADVDGKLDSGVRGLVALVFLDDVGPSSRKSHAVALAFAGSVEVRVRDISADQRVSRLVQINSSAIVVRAIAGDARFRYADLLVVFHGTAASSRRAAGHVDADEFVVMHFVIAHRDVGNGEGRQAAINLNANVFVVGDEVGVYDR